VWEIAVATIDCLPEELDKAAELSAKGHFGEVAARELPNELEPRLIRPGLVHTMRTAGGAMGDYLNANVVVPFKQVRIASDRFMVEQYALLGAARRGLRPGNNLDATLHDIAIADSKGVLKGGNFPEDQVAAARAIKQGLDKLVQQEGWTPELYWDYRELMKTGRMAKGVNDAAAMGSPAAQEFVSRVNEAGPKARDFLRALETPGIVKASQPTMQSAMEDVVSTIARKRFLDPKLDALEKDVVLPYLEGAYIHSSRPLVQPEVGQQHFPFAAATMAQRQAKLAVNDDQMMRYFREWKAHQRGALTNGDVHGAQMMNNVFDVVPYGAKVREKLLGVDRQFDPRDVLRLGAHAQQMTYLGALGARPASALQNLSQLIPTYAHMGTKHTMVGLTKALNPTGYLELESMNLLSAPMESVILNVDALSRAGRAISAINHYGMLMFEKVDRYARATTAWAAESKFREAEQLGTLASFKSFSREKTAMLQKLIGQGKIDDARQAYMFQSVEGLQYIYGPAGRPQALRGALGQYLSSLSNYPLYTLEMGLEMAKSAQQQGQYAPIARMIGLSAGIMYTGAQFLNVDMKSFIPMLSMPNSVTPVALRTADAMVNSMSSTVKWGYANAFGVGETDFEKNLRVKAYGDLGNRLGTQFVPGYRSLALDIPEASDLINRGDLYSALAKMTGMPRTAAIREEYYKARRKEQRLEKKIEATE
jgi:hypothetical protein